MQTKIIAICAAMTAAVVVTALFINRQPKSYNECIEQNIGKAETRESSLIINAMCRKRFPKKMMTDEEVFGR